MCVEWRPCATGLSFESVPLANRVDFGGAAATRGTIWASGIVDRDGSLSGAVGGTVASRPAPHGAQAFVTSSCFTAVPSMCQDRPDWVRSL